MFATRWIQGRKRDKAQTAKEARMKTATRSALALSSLALLGLSLPALAAPSRDEIATKVVRFNDLDLSTAAGAQTLYERITAAARSVCRGVEVAQARACKARAVEDAVRAVGSPLLSSVHRSTAGRVATR
jgi:UrcA family protein